MVDVTESPIERPKKTTKILFWQKEKTQLKSQLVVDKISKEIICVEQSEGKKHDYRLFKESKTYVQQLLKYRLTKVIKDFRKNT